MATKMKDQAWIDKSQAERFASLLYPNLTDASTRSQMARQLDMEGGRGGGLRRRIEAGETKQHQSWWENKRSK